MDYIPILEIACFTFAGFLLVGTFKGLNAGEVHFLVQWLFESGFKRGDRRFGAVVVMNFTIAATLIGVAVFHLVTLNAGNG